MSLVLLLLACGDAPTPEAVTPKVEAPAPPPAGGVRFLPDTEPIACDNLVAAPLPDPGLPWDDVESFCSQAPRGAPWTEAAPPEDWDQYAVRNAYGAAVHDFMWSKRYRGTDAQGKPGLGWQHDARWRLSGNYVGCPPVPCPDTNPECKDADQNGSYKGTHLWVRVWYSPEVVDWMCKHRREDPGDLDADDLPPGSVIIKEMHDTVPTDLRVVEGTTSTLWIDTEGYEDNLSWLYMIKGSGSHDGWFWGELQEPPAEGEQMNLPILDRTGFTRTPFPAPGTPAWDDMLAKRGEGWLPTSTPHDSVVYPSESYGNYCIRCHASAESEATFSSLLNILGQEPGYSVLADGEDSPYVDRNEHLEELPSPLCVKPGFGCFPQALPDGQPAEGFEARFPQFAGTRLADVWADRLPGQTWDHAMAGAGGPEGLVTSDQCIVCHDTNGAGNMRVRVSGDGGEVQLGLSPWAEWSASPMGLAGRDPIFYAQLEGERNRALSEGWTEQKVACVQNLCLHCHGVMGQREQMGDTKGQVSHVEACAGVLPEPMMETTFGAALFTRDQMDAWPGEADAQASHYGGLARDGISCAVCHRMSEEGLGTEATYTGNFKLDPPDTIYGPFEDVKTAPMENALGMTPQVGEAIQSSELCGSCHAVLLPVFDNAGNLRPVSEAHPEGPYAYEQATYLEWLNSAFNEDSPSGSAETARSCQDCHMPHEFTPPTGPSQDLNFWIANIQDESYPASEHSLQDELQLTERDGYRRHTLYGLNLFVNAYFQQFPMLLGYRQVPPTSSSALPPLLNAMDEGLKFARYDTADVIVSPVQRDAGAGALRFDVTVQNKGGHNLPSGVGFRRMFLEVVVLAEDGRALWASGRTDNLGQLLVGITDAVLPGEAPSALGELLYQPHHQVITRGDQVQIYEELNTDSAGQLTSSFIHRYNDVKDNRLRPTGWRWDNEYAALIKPVGVGEDPDYAAAQLTGADTTRYEITLPAEAYAQAATVRVRLYSQATPPRYLQQRFDQGLMGPYSRDSKRLYYIVGHTDTSGTTNLSLPDDLPDTYIEDWRLLITGVEVGL